MGVTLKPVEDFQEILNQVPIGPVFIYKHSNRCPVSRWAWVDIETKARSLADDGKFFLVDVVLNRQLSAQIANHFQVRHESPQILKIVSGVCTAHASHENVQSSFFD
jgi:bacillithiol system protein YtxJ